MDTAKRPQHRLWHAPLIKRSFITAAVVAVATAGAVGAPVAPAGAVTAASVVLGAGAYGFNHPFAELSANGALWVANAANSVVELNPVDGSVILTINQPAVGLNSPSALAVSGTHLWVANSGANSVSEINATTGALISTISGTSSGIDQPTALASDGTHLWVANAGNNSVTEINEATGAVTTTLSNSSYGFNTPAALLYDGATLWVANAGGNSLTAIDPTNATLVGVLNNAAYGFNNPDALASDGGALWITNNGGNSVTEINESDGALVRIVTGAGLGLDGPSGITIGAGNVYVANTSANSVTILNETTGGLVGLLNAASNALSLPHSITVANDAVWVANLGGDSVTEVPLSASPTAPSAPQSITLTPANGAVTVSWSPPVTNGGAPITGYSASNGQGATCSAPLNTKAEATSTCVITGLTNGTSYLFSVTATNSTGTSSSTSAFATPATVPGAPTAVTARAGNGIVTVSWTDPTATGGAPITSYVVADGIGQGCTAPPTATSCSVSGIVPGFPVTFTVSAVNAAGTGPQSVASAPVTAAVPPSAPVDVRVTPQNQALLVSWQAATDGGSPVTSYTATTVGNPAHQCTISGATVTADRCTITGLTNGISYSVTVTATNSAGTSPASSPSASVTPKPLPGLVTVTSIKVAATAVTITWRAAPTNGGEPIVSYTVTDGKGHTCLQSVMTNLTCTISGLTQGVSVVLSIYATSAQGNGPTATVKVTPAGPPAPPMKVLARLNGRTAVVWWNAGANNGSPITSFHVSSVTGSLSCAAIGTKRTCTVSGLLPHKYYAFVVTATNAAGISKPSAKSPKIGPVH